ncbi:efflux RND transporter periplasmic adaptor subunit [Brevundimonas sp. 2R-24]|uniref:Efflux RND transporter periplasmic adaptor subunit n=1 Tax=Peiella sedimenti TaxID=3061083 RepID=A0ABT8SN40_9CAUL|nr:efflux RND transporter periplasmic adaptor subunit [Caulobacteraceae bacterium XZ-24]
MICLALGLAPLASCGSDEQAPAAAPAAAQAGRLVVTTETIPDAKSVSAVVASRDLAEARARISGVLVRLNVREGDQVRSGQVIGVVADERIGMQTAALDALVAAAESEVRRARAELARVQTLFDRGIYAQARLDQAQAAYEAAEGQARAARAQREASVELGAQGRILAPAAGRVLTADVPQGSMVTAGQSIATITAGPVVLRIEVPEAQGGELRVGQTVQVDGLPQPGTIRQVYPAARGGRVIADVSVAGLEGWSLGRRIDTRITLGEREAIVIPRSYVATRFGIDYVRTLGPGDVAVEAPVQLGPDLSDGRVEVLSGLAEGDVVLPAEAR